MTEFLSSIQDDLKAATDTRLCSQYKGKYGRLAIDEETKRPRYCAVCNRLRPAEEGDLGRFKPVVPQDQLH